jgi:hypothetical protein
VDFDNTHAETMFTAGGIPDDIADGMGAIWVVLIHLLLLRPPLDKNIYINIPSLVWIDNIEIIYRSYN